MSTSLSPADQLTPKQPPVTLPPGVDRNLSPKQTATKLNISITTLWRLERTDPTFPRKKAISPNRRVYSLAELEAWLAGR
jgi:predicted DNA-binding transcriptional regulator AlpA